MMLPLQNIQARVRGPGVWLVANVRATSYVRQRAREAVQHAITNQNALIVAVRRDASLASLLAVRSDAVDPPRAAAREALMRRLTGPMQWVKEPATLMVEYASMELRQLTAAPLDAGHRFYWGNTEDMGRLAYANLGRLAAIGEQKTTQLFAELASQFDPNVRTAYENIFADWGGDIRERSVDLKTGQIRPRELTLDLKMF